MLQQQDQKLIDNRPTDRKTDWLTGASRPTERSERSQPVPVRLSTRADAPQQQQQLQRHFSAMQR